MTDAKGPTEQELQQELSYLRLRLEIAETKKRIHDLEKAMQTKTSWPYDQPWWHYPNTTTTHIAM